jgi:AI-2 transport protein TqsA
VTTGFLVLLIVAFMLAEASSLPEKLRTAFSLTRAGEEHLVRLFNSINRYMLIKTLLSIATGVGVWIWLRTIGIEYASPWPLPRPCSTSYLLLETSS